MNAPRLLRAGLVVATLVVLAVLARTVDWPEAWRVIRAASLPMLLLAAVLNVVSIALKGVRWWVFLRAIDVPSLALALRATFAGAALNNVLIANTGEAARVLLVARAADVPSERVLATLALERLFEFVGYFLVLGAAVVLLPLPPALDDASPIAAAGLVAMLLVIVYLVRHPGSTRTSVPAASDSVLGRVREYGRGFLRTMAAVSTGPRFTAAFLASSVVWGLQIVTYHITAMAADFEISLAGTIAALLAVNLGFLTRATPGNVGVFQAVYAVTAAAFGLDADDAVGVALLIQMQQLLPITLLGLLAAPGMVRPGRPAARPPAAERSA